MEKDSKQLVFESIWVSKVVPTPTVSAATNRNEVKKQVKRKSPAKAAYEVVLIHESGVNWRLDCWQMEGEALDVGYYDHLAAEALKRELLRILKQEKPETKEVYAITLVLKNIGVDVPRFLMMDTNKNLFEGDFWSDFDEEQWKHYSTCARSYMWAFYLKDFSDNEKIASRSFVEYPADETDISFLDDYEIWMSKYPGLSVFDIADL